jgi:LEA14-like dessication related protein
MRAVILWGLFALGLVGCADLSTFEQPKIALVDLKLRGGKLLAQDFLLTLRIDNPNAYGFRLNGAVADVFLAGQPVARALSYQPLKVPAYGHADLNLIATVQTFTLLQQILNLTHQTSIDYRLRGHLSASLGFHRDLRIPFEDQGSIDFSRLFEEQAIR